MADPLPKEAKDFDLDLIQTCDQLLHLPSNLDSNTFDSFQHLQDPPQRWTVRGVGDLMRDGLVLPFQLLAQATLRHRIDQQRQGHDHQQPLNPRGFFHKQRCNKKQRVFEKAEPAFCLGLPLVPSDDLGIAELLRLNMTSAHKTRVILLGVLYACDSGSHTSVELPLRGFDRGLRGGPTCGGLPLLLKPLARLDLMILPLLPERGQRLLSALRCLKTLGLQVKQVLGDGLMVSLLGLLAHCLGAPGSCLRLENQPALFHAKVA